MRSKLAIAALAIGLATAVPAAAQVREGELVYVEQDDGSLLLYRRVDRPEEGDRRAQFQRIPEQQQEAYMRSIAGRAIPVIPRSATMTGGAQMQPRPSGAQYQQPMQYQQQPQVQYQQQPQVVYQQPQVQYQQPQMQRVQVQQPMERHEPMIRPRLGLSVLGGGILNDQEGWVGGLALRVGAQLGDAFALYYQGTGLINGLDTNRGGDFDQRYDIAYTLWNSLLAEVVLFDVVSVGAGPSVDFQWDCDQNQHLGGSQSQACPGDSGDANFGLHGRVALNLGRHFRMGRGAMNLSFEVHPTWYGNNQETVTLLGGIGGELY